MKQKKTSITEYLFFITILLSPMMMFSILHIQIYLWVAFFVTMIVSVKNRRIIISNDILLNLMIIEMVISCLLALATDMPIGYKKNGFVNLFMIVILYFFSACVFSSISKSRKLFELLYKAIKWMILLELLWCVIQYVIYVVCDIDINQKIFVETLHLTDVASSYIMSTHQFRPSGLAHHPAIMAPLITIGFFMFESPYIKILCLMVAAICENATALLAGLLCCACTAFGLLFNVLKERKINKNRFILIISIIILAVVFLLISGMAGYIINKTYELFVRLTTNNGTGVYSLDSSSSTHKRYYTELWRVIKNNGTIQNLFGFGPANSGYGYSRELGQYIDKGSWTVESDFVNKLLSYGIIGFIIQYALLLKISTYAYKKNHSYVCFFIIILEGITYNVQFSWVFLLELMVYYSLRHGFDIMPNRINNQTIQINETLE